MKPACDLRRVPLDLADVAARQALFAELGREAERALVVCEGLIIYLTAEEVGALARDLAAPPSFRRWVTDLVSPGLLKLLQKKLGPQLDQASAPLKFAPEEGPEFFVRHGWRPLEVPSMLHAAARLGRLPLWMRFFALFPPPKTPGSRPWSGSAGSKKGRLEPPGGEAFGSVLGYNPRIEITVRAAPVGELS